MEVAQDTLPMQWTCAIRIVYVPRTYKGKEPPHALGPLLNLPLPPPLPGSCVDTTDRNSEPQLALR